jgi:hypothetical protein
VYKHHDIPESCTALWIKWVGRVDLGIVQALHICAFSWNKKKYRRKKEYLIMWFLARPLITLHQKSCVFVHHHSMLRNMDRTVCISTSLPKTLHKIGFLVVLKVSIEHWCIWRERSCMLHLSATTFPQINVAVMSYICHCFQWMAVFGIKVRPSRSTAACSQRTALLIYYEWCSFLPVFVVEIEFLFLHYRSVGIKDFFPLYFPVQPSLK